MELKEIKNLATLRAQRKRLQTEQQAAIDGVKQSVQTEQQLLVKRVNTQVGNAQRLLRFGADKTQQLLQGTLSGVRKSLKSDETADELDNTEEESEKGKWTLPLWMGIGGLIGVIVVFLFFDEEDVEQKKQPSTTSSGKQQDIELTQRIHAAMDAYFEDKQVAKKAGDKENSFFALAKMIGLPLMRQVFNDDFKKELINRLLGQEGVPTQPASIDDDLPLNGTKHE